jgi:hypothetical protein
MTDDAKLAVEGRKQFIKDFVKKYPLETSGARLYDELVERYPEVSAGGHRGMVGRLFPTKPWEIGEKACPNVARGTCKVVVTTMADALELFGHRVKKTNLQSYCKACRNRARREARAARNEKARKAAAAKAAKEE